MQLSDVKFRDDISKLLISMDAKQVCEVGVLRGAGLKRLSVPCVETVYGVDQWAPYGENSNYDLVKCYEQARKVAAKLGNIQLVTAPSIGASEIFSDGFFDLVYVDANHFYEPMCDDLRSWWPKVRVGGVFSGHDYVEKSRFGDEFGVMQAVDEFVIEHNLKLYTTQDKWTSWLVLKES